MPNRLIHRWKKHLLGLAVLTITSGTLWSAELAQWRKDLQQKAAKQEVFALFAFEGQPGSLVRNLKSSTGFSEMIIAHNPAYNAEQQKDFPQWVEGRWPGKYALRLGTAQGSIGRTHVYNTGSQDFTIEAWVRILPPAAGGHNGHGVVVVAGMGSGWSDGWKLRLDRWGAEFSLGRTPGKEKGEGVVAAGGKSDQLTPGVWHQMVGVLGGNKLSLYIDGALLSEKEFDGVYRQPEIPGNSLTVPELDRGGLQIGSNLSQLSAVAFDLDELGVYSRALTAAEIAAAYESGKPSATAAAQQERFNDQLGEALFAQGIAFTMPKDTFGYFPSDRAVPLQIHLDARCATALRGDNAVKYAVKDDQGKLVLEGTHTFYVAAGSQNEQTIPLALPRCGLYNLSATWLNPQKKPVTTGRFFFAVRAPLPERKDISPRSMFAGYVGLNNDTMSFGTNMERIIQPIWRRFKDGTTDYSSSDRMVEECRKAGLEILYCLMAPPPADGSLSREAHAPEMVENMPVFAAHVRALAERYKGKVRYWEMLNEPNAGFPGMTAALYVQLLKTAAQILKEVDPQAVIVGPCGTSNYHTWTEEVLAAGGGQYIDILSLHNYLGYSPLNAYWNYGRLQHVRASMRRYLGRELPVWNTECGIHQPARIDGKAVSDDELLKMYGGRAARHQDGFVKVRVDAIMMVNEHLSACWQVQSLLTELADGVEKYFMLMRASGNYPYFAGTNEAVSQKGIALAAVQSLLTRGPQARFFPAGLGSLAAGVMLTMPDGENVAALFADHPVKQVFKACGKAGVKYAGMDYFGNPLEFVTTESGLLVIDLGPEPVYVRGVDAGFRANEPFVVVSDKRVLDPEKTELVRISVLNPLDRPAKAVLRAKVSCGTAKADPEEFELAAREKKEVSVVWNTGKMWRGNHHLDLTLELDGQPAGTLRETSFRSDGMRQLIPFLPFTGADDVRPEVWAEALAEKGNTAKQAVLGRPVEGAPSPLFWRGEEDLSYEVKTAWSQAGLHFLLTVRDDKLRLPQTDAEAAAPWIYDNLELFIDCRPDKERAAVYSPGATQFAIIPQATDAMTPCKTVTAGKYAPVVKLDCRGMKVPGGYQIAGLITPLDANKPFAAGTKISLDFSVDDNDDDAAVGKNVLGRRIQMALHGTAGNSSFTSAWGNYLLKEAKK